MNRDGARCGMVQSEFTRRDTSGSIEHEERDNKGAFHVTREGRRLAEMTYSRTNAKLIVIDHSDIDGSLKGQGVGRRLLDALVAWARETEARVIALCPFAKSQFDRDPTIRDVLR